MNKVLVAAGLLLAVGAFTAWQFAARKDSDARYDLYQRREWRPIPVRAQNPTPFGRRRNSR